MVNQPSLIINKRTMDLITYPLKVIPVFSKLSLKESRVEFRLGSASVTKLQRFTFSSLARGSKACFCKFLVYVENQELPADIDYIINLAHVNYQLVILNVILRNLELQQSLSFKTLRKELFK